MDAFAKRHILLLFEEVRLRGRANLQNYVDAAQL
jgi:hypothetical protein